MNHSLSASASAFREFNSLRCAVSTTFFLVFVKFFHRSGEAVFVSAVREATQSSTACQQLFSTFRFFLSLDALLSSRGENLFVSALAVNNFFFSFRKILFQPFASPSSRRTLCTCQTRTPAVRFPLPPGARSVYGLFRAKGQEVFFKFFSKKQNPARGGVMSFPFDARRSGIRSRLRACPGGAAPAFGSAARPTDSSRRWSAARAPCRTHSRRWVGPQARPAPDRCSRRG